MRVMPMSAASIGPPVVSTVVMIRALLAGRGLASSHTGKRGGDVSATADATTDEPPAPEAIGAPAGAVSAVTGLAGGALSTARRFAGALLPRLRAGDLDDSDPD